MSALLRLHGLMHRRWRRLMQLTSGLL